MLFKVFATHGIRHDLCVRITLRGALFLAAWALLMATMMPVQSLAQDPIQPGDLFIGFETPEYALGAPPEPWNVRKDGNGSAQVVDVAAYEGSQALAVYGWGPGGTSNRCWAEYPVEITTTDGTVTMQLKVRPSVYNPGSYDAGFVTLGGFAVINNVRNWDYGDTSVYAYRNDLFVYFDMAKPYATPFSPSHLALRVGNSYTATVSLGSYARGEYHDFTITWNQDTGKVDVSVVMPGGEVRTATLNSNHAPLTKMHFYGQSMEAISDPCRFDNFALIIPQPVTYIITASANPAEGGSVSGEGVYDENAEVILTAVANDGYTFVNWTESDVEVSAEAEYIFTAIADRAVVANFVPTVPTLWAIY
jgi:hypothetical protein